MKIYRMELHGHVLECREGDLGAEQVFLDGRCVSNRPLAGWLTLVGNPVLHCFEVLDGGGTPSHVEVRWEAAPKSLGLKWRVRVLVNGRDRAVLEPMKSPPSPRCCGNCGYCLDGLPVEAGEIRCPECGRHSSAALVGMT